MGESELFVDGEDMSEDVFPIDPDMAAEFIPSELLETHELVDTPAGFHAADEVFQLCLIGFPGMVTPLGDVKGLSSRVAPLVMPYMLRGPSFSSCPP